MRWPWSKARPESNRPSFEETVVDGSCAPKADSIPDGAIRRRILFSGSVQGVGFRFTCEGVAERHDVTGWVRNLDDGDVLVEAQGRPRDVDAFCEEIVHPAQRVWYRATLAGSEELEPVAERTFVIRG